MRFITKLYFAAFPFVEPRKKEPVSKSSLQFNLPKRLSVEDMMKQMNQKKHTIPMPTNTAPYRPPPPIFSMNVMKPKKVQQNHSLTYKNVPLSVIDMLRKRLNQDQPSMKTDTAQQTSVPAIKTSSSSCTFLAGSFVPMVGNCSKYGACRQGKLEYGKHVSII